MRTDIPEELAQDPWFKIVEFLQHNWAVIFEDEDPVRVVFFGDTRGVFDEIQFGTLEEAVVALVRNGFTKYLEDPKAPSFISLPRGEFHERPHPNGPIYSTGKYWR